MSYKAVEQALQVAMKQVMTDLATEMYYPGTIYSGFGTRQGIKTMIEADAPMEEIMNVRPVGVSEEEMMGTICEIKMELLLFKLDLA